MEGLPNGTYAIIVYDGNWKPACRGIQIVLGDGHFTNAPSTSRIIRQAETTIEKEVQAAKRNWSATNHNAIEETTSFVGNVLDKNTYHIYPNPAQNELFINLRDYAGQKANIRLLNQLGQTIQTIAFDKLPSEAIQVDLTNTDNGLHLLTIQLENSQVVTEKVMINRF